MEYVLKTENLTKVYSRRPVVNKINLQIKKGDIYGFVGRNGSGKSTTIKMIVGLTKPTNGGMELFGSKNLNEGRKKVGTVIEYPSLYPYMTARQNVEAHRIFLGVKDKSVTDEVLDIVGLNDTGKKKAKNFSLGMKQRLAIALALIGNPEFLFLDEPINGLDPLGIRDIRDLILKLNKERGITIMISSHILDELIKIATCYGVINDGVLVDQFEADELKRRVRERVCLRVNNPELACEVLSKDVGVSDFSLNEDGSIYIFDCLDKTGEINTCLAGNDIILQSMTHEGSRESGDYEEYFIKLMGGNKND